MSSPSKRTKVSKTKVEAGGTGDSKKQFFSGETSSARVHPIHRWAGIVFVTFYLNPAKCVENVGCKCPNRNADNHFIHIFAYRF